MMVRKHILAAAIVTALGSGLTAGFSLPAQASDVKVIVNGSPITDYDIARRAAFLKLQRKKGNLTQMAREELTDDMLKRQEMRRLNIVVSDTEVTQAFERFATNNKMTLAQLNGVLDKSGVTADHFKEYIRLQMGWGRALGTRGRSQGGSRVSEQDAVQRMLKDGGKKPVSTEYTLQQVIFVVPAADRGNLAKRRNEANALRAKFSGCDSTRDIAKGTLDVTVRDLGRFVEQELPPEWSKQVTATSVGHATVTQDTDKGVEFLGVCATRQISDDRVARLVFSQEAAAANQKPDATAEAVNKKYLDDLRKKASIVNR
ncbi:peptidylprolyl isomerase [Phyllobacterium sp. P30BS-XVII]|uniref:SurA N-terminal domain-containing protein n=1 Tax=Phyllobacterium sp. P30BS-XVII TaxID=2587046 RepID=UPI000DD75303|nr:peptidylprolyl isomerase [Phyllobacterium sp. P30BS-XVII]MBA8901128.1 peptidyl-prolyl cis-trans isomerase SurA [Phyllobacterium sp. P30BS-XVII]